MTHSARAKVAACFVKCQRFGGEASLHEMVIEVIEHQKSKNVRQKACEIIQMVQSKIEWWMYFDFMPEWETIRTSFDNPNLEIMQYTWLKDKNGLGIYEGDILKDRDDDLIIINWKKVGEWDEIYYDFNWFIYEIFYSENHSWLGWRTRQEIEVIWNIYENPELLNNK